MASSKVLSKIFSRLQSLKVNRPSSLAAPLSPQFRLSASSKSISRSIPSRLLAAALSVRLPKELGSVASMLPLYSAIASAMIRSNLAMESQSWGLVPNGVSMPL